ncbi:hypothetical protein QUA44_28710 [Microcoleus sp. N9_A2]|uniref:hypothetical protein n=1 Tax=Microcoleus sp. N9_A2 TaxID=3055381 RepID=UPI002FD26A68
MTAELYISSILSHQVGDRNLSFFTLLVDRPYFPKVRSPLFSQSTIAPDGATGRLKVIQSGNSRQIA